MRYVLPLLVSCLITCSSLAQQPFFAPGGNQNGLNNNQGFNGQGNGLPAQGGGANADFDSLIDLIVSTVASETWAENGGGEAEIRPYVGGVYADAKGLLRRLQAKANGSLAGDLRRAEARLGEVSAAAALVPETDQNANPRAAAKLRCISLGRLERELQRRRTAGEKIDQSVLTLAGLRRVRYVILVPPSAAGEPGDVVLAGPAGDWRVVGDGRVIAAGDEDRGASIVRLDDLLTLLRRTWGGSSGAFGCSINPRPESLAKAQAFLNQSQTKPVAPGKRDEWLAELRDKVGVQDIEVFGVDPQSRVAGVLVEADHHMKLIGMGLAEGAPGVENYLEGLAKKRGDSSTGVLRWWFAMNYSAVLASPDRHAFEISGPGAKVLSEKQLLTSRGQRVPAGQGDELAEGFANSFSLHFDSLCRKYPVYSELRNVFDLALATELIRQASQSSPDSWRPGFFLDARSLPLPGYEPATTVQTVVNHQVVNRRKFVAGVSGGVWSDARSVLSSKIRRVDPSDLSPSETSPLADDPITPPADLSNKQWWWDVE